MENYNFSIPIEPHYSTFSTFNDRYDLYRFEFYNALEQDEYDPTNGDLLEKNKCIAYFLIDKGTFKLTRKKILLDCKDKTLGVTDNVLIINNDLEFKDFQLIDGCGEGV